MHTDERSTAISRTWEWTTPEPWMPQGEWWTRRCSASELRARMAEPELDPIHRAEIKVLLDAHDAAIRAGLSRPYGVSKGDYAPMPDPDAEGPHDYVDGYAGPFEEETFHG